MDRSRTFEAALVIAIIALAALLYVSVVSTSRDTSGWESQFNGNVDYMFVGSDDTLYTFSGNTVSAMAVNGSVLWRQSVPAEWKVLNDWEMPVYASEGGVAGKSFRHYPIVAESDGCLYLFAISRLNATDIESVRNSISLKNIGTDYYYLSPDIPFISKQAVVMKISGDGTFAWNYSFLNNLPSDYIGGLVSPDAYTMQKPVAISVAGDRIYVFHDYTEDVLDADGRLLFSIPDVAAPAAVDGLGRIYSVRAVRPTQEMFNESMPGSFTPDGQITVGQDYMMIPEDLTFMLTSGIMDAHGSDGSLLWSCDIGRNATRPYLEQDVWPKYNSLPLLSNGQLYVPIEDGIIAVSLDGRVNWTATINDGTYLYFSLMPVDSRGNVYMMKLSASGISGIVPISPDGQVSRNGLQCYIWPYYGHSLGFNPGPVPAGVKDGVMYGFESKGFGITRDEFEEMLASRQFTADTVRAYDLVDGRELWNFSVPTADRHVATLNETNVKEATGYVEPFNDQTFPGLVPRSLIETGVIKVYPGRDVLYLSYEYEVHESPLIADMSRCVYARGFYALDNNGKLLWEKQFNDTLGQVAVGNSTIYYSLNNGRIGGSGPYIAAGAAMVAIAYAFLRFFMVGAVARARSRLEENENRNVVLRYVVDHPGVTTANVAKGTRMNTGTIRYHLFILTMNHKIVTYKDAGKFLRFFKNSGAYTEAEKDLLALVRRRPLQRVLQVLLERPGSSCNELAQELDISVAAVSRHVGELADKGVIEKLPAAERGSVYSVKREHRERIIEALGND